MGKRQALLPQVPGRLVWLNGAQDGTSVETDEIDAVGHVVKYLLCFVESAGLVERTVYM